MDSRQASDHRARRRDGAPNRRARVLLLAALIALVAAGCGSESDDGGSAGDGGDSGGGATTPTTELTVTFWSQGKNGGPPWEATLTCDPAGGTHPDPEKACALLAADPDALEPVPPDVACTAIYGGPEVATIVGTIDGEKVNATFNRSGGCEIDRWDRMTTVLQGGD